MFSLIDSADETLSNQTIDPRGKSKHIYIVWFTQIVLERAK
jgi:hypothetical protein